MITTTTMISQTLPPHVSYLSSWGLGGQHNFICQATTSSQWIFRWPVPLAWQVPQRGEPWQGLCQGLCTWLWWVFVHLSFSTIIIDNVCKIKKVLVDRRPDSYHKHLNTCWCCARIDTAGCGWFIRSELLSKCFIILFREYTIHCHEADKVIIVSCFMIMPVISLSFILWCHNVSWILCTNTFFYFVYT